MSHDSERIVVRLSWLFGLSYHFYFAQIFKEKVIERVPHSSLATQYYFVGDFICIIDYPEQTQIQIHIWFFYWDFWVNIDSWVYDARRTGSTPHWVHEYFVVITEWVLIYLFVEDSNYHLDSLDSITRKYSILRKWWATHLLKREPITGLYPPPVRIKYLYPGSSNALLVAQW